jgi:hypothetical protein
MDFKSAFLNGVLKKEVYLEPPEGFHPASLGHVWALCKSLYGLKDVPAIWYNALAEHLKTPGYTRSVSDACLFYKDYKGTCYFVGVYVDDMLVVGKGRMVWWLKNELSRKYEVKDLGEAKWFLNMEITRDCPNHLLSISQHQYVLNILKKYGLADIRGYSTPMAANLSLPKQPESTINQHVYQSMLGSLMYAMVGTRPDIAYTVGILAQHSSAPGDPHLVAMKRVYSYLKSTSNFTLTLGGSLELIGYVDSDWAGDQNSDYFG